ncbi:MAG: glutathione S-transferase family protein [Pseudomonadales bacterium]
MQPPIIYGVPFSQPVRAVMWLMLYKRTPFELVLTNPGSKGDNGSRNPNFLAKNPAGTIPTLEDPQTGFCLGEAHAIMCYLANKHGWTDVYPEAPEARARVDWYLNYHHRNLRDASIGLVAPKIRKDLNIPEAMQQAARATLTNALKALDTGWLEGNTYLTGDALTLADFAAYVEIGQLQPGFTNVYDFSPFANVQRWLQTMQQVDGHDAVHLVLTELGDISEQAPEMEAIKQANISALKRLKAELSNL